MIKTIEKEICRFDEYKAKIDIAIPIQGEIAIDEKQDEFFEEMLINQMMRGLDAAREKYKNSELPNLFIEYQNYIITNNLPEDILGMYDGSSNDIYFDADTISDIRGVEASFVHGHEVGHKIIRYRNMTGCLNDIAQILGVSLNGNEHRLKELLCDECGNLVAKTSRDRVLFNHIIEEERRKHIQRKILYHIYK